jgi:8-oxo-dGTP pyrophosphatase MutT (NUDIX family)
VDEGEKVEQAAVREAMEELGVIVEVQRLAAEIRFDQSTQFYYLVKRTGGEFGTGTGEEFTDSDPADPEEGTYLPIWMPLAELPRHEKVFPSPLARLVLESMTNGFPNEPVLIVEKTK